MEGQSWFEEKKYVEAGEGHEELVEGVAHVPLHEDEYGQDVAQDPQDADCGPRDLPTGKFPD